MKTKGIADVKWKQHKKRAIINNESGKLHNYKENVKGAFCTTIE